jgi:excisionase family DNA binding protein
LIARLLTAREVAEQLAVSTGALLRWTRAGRIPAVKLPSGAVRYRPEAIEAWLAEREMGAAEREVLPTRANRAQPGAYASAVSSSSLPTPPISVSTNEEDHDGRT